MRCSFDCAAAPLFVLLCVNCRHEISKTENMKRVSFVFATLPKPQKHLSFRWLAHETSKTENMQLVAGGAENIMIIL